MHIGLADGALGQTVVYHGESDNILLKVLEGG